MATATNDKPVRLGDLPVVKTNILENARQYDKGVVGGYSGTFPLTAASQGGIYLLPSTGKFYVCETAYNGAQISAPNSNFVELSVWKNHDRLANLIKVIYTDKGLKQVNTWLDIPYPNEYNSENSSVIIFNSGTSLETKTIFKIHQNKKQYVAQSLALESFVPIFVFIKIK